MSFQLTLATNTQVDLINNNNSITQPIKSATTGSFDSHLTATSKFIQHSTLLNHNLTLVSQPKLKSQTSQLDKLFSSSSWTSPYKFIYTHQSSNIWSRTINILFYQLFQYNCLDPHTFVKKLKNTINTLIPVPSTNHKQTKHIHSSWYGHLYSRIYSSWRSQKTTAI